MAITNPHKFWHNVKASAVLIVLGLMLSLPYLLQSQVPLDTELLTSNTVTSTGDYHQIEQAYSVYPAFAFIADTAQSKDSLLWNPDAQMGTPFLAAWTTRCYSPFTAPFYFLALPLALGVSVLLKLWVAGIAAFYTARKLGYAPLLSLLCAVAFQCSHALLAQPIEPFSDVVPWVPLLFLFAERMYLRQARYWPVGAVIIALMLLSGDWVATTCCIATMFVYIVIHELMYPFRKGYLITGSAFLLSLAVGLALVTQQLLPYLAYMNDTIPVADSTKSLPSFMQADLLLVPHTGVLRHFGMVHVGIVQLLTTLLWLVIRPSLLQHHLSKVDALQITSLILVGITLTYGHFFSDTALAVLLSHHQLLAPLSFMMALSTIITLAIWSELTPDQCHESLKRGRILVPVLLAGLLVPASLALFSSPVSGLTITGILCITVVIVLLYLVVLFYSLVHPKSIVICIGFMLITFLDLGIMNHWNTYRSPASTLDHDTAMGIAQSQQSTGRSLAQVDAFLGEAEVRPELFNFMPTSHLLIPLTGLESLSPTFRQSLQLQSVTTEGIARFKKLNETPLLELHDQVIYQATWTPETLKTDSAAIISKDIMLAPWDKVPKRPTWSADPENVKLRIEINPTAPSVLAVHRILNKDWVATIDGEVTETFWVNGIFTGVKVEPGDNLVRITYRPKEFTFGKNLSIIALILVILGYIHLGYHRVRTTRIIH